MNTTTTPLIIAHRGASGYLPEHTLAAKALAHAFGADCLEQDVVLTQDDVPVVFHDLILDEITNVAEVFSTRRRADGHFYVIDFTFAELRRLEVHERIDPLTHLPTYPQRFQQRCDFKIEALATEIAFIQELDRVRSRQTALYTEVKSPAFHRAHGKDLTRSVLDTLARFGYHSKDCPVWLQCFDFAELTRIHDELNCQLKLVQLIGENAWQESDSDYDALRTPAGLQAIARIASGIGPWIPQLVQWQADGAVKISELTAQAHALGLAVHPYTFRVDDLPAHAPSSEAVHRVLFDSVKVDGLFSDFCDVSLALRGVRR